MSDVWRVSVMGDGIRLMGHVDSQLELTALARAVDPMGWLVVVSPVDPGADLAAGLESILAPHPCRDCDRPYGDHPHDGCPAWR